jgi:hypothetical protein
MKIFRRPVITSLLGAIILTGAIFSFTNAQSTPMTDAQIVRIRSNCISAKNTLTQLHASDALLRVNRGQIYESMTTKLMSRFNSRVDSNHYDVKDLLSITQSYGSALNNFRTDYQAYEEQLSGALSIDCTKEPVAFYDSVASSRTKRTQVHVDVVILHQYIDNYEAAYNDFATNFFKSHGVNE